MRSYVALGSLFIILLVVGGVIIARDGLYRDSLDSIVGTSLNPELIEEVSLSQKGERVFEKEVALLIDVVDPKISDAVPFQNDDIPSEESLVLPPELDDPILEDVFNAPSEPTVPSHDPPLFEATFPIDINTADFETLQHITGVGPVIGQRIIDDRSLRGLFYDIGDIRRVNGIGDATFEKMRHQITVGNVVPPPPPAPIEVSESPPLPPSTETAEPDSAPVSEEAQPAVFTKVNINTADQEQLQEIKGIGPVLSERIVEYRTHNGSFQNLEDIKNVKGIGDKTFEKMRDEIAI